MTRRAWLSLLAAASIALLGILILRDDAPQVEVAVSEPVPPTVVVESDRTSATGGSRRANSASDSDPAVQVSHETFDSTPRATKVPPVALGSKVHGRVVDAAGAPVEGALVTLRGARSTTGSDGNFALSIRPLTDEHLTWARGTSASAASTRILAIKSGFLPGTYDGVLAGDGSGDPVFPPFVVVPVTMAALSIEGRVVDDAGLPIPAARVWIADPTVLGERLFLETCLNEGANPGWIQQGPQPVFADAQGRFVITGLDDRPYRVEALVDATMAHVARDAVAAGSRDVVLRIPTRAMHPRVAGRVITRDGRPVVGAKVRVMRVIHQSFNDHMRSGARCETNTDGHFELQGVPESGVYLSIEGGGIEPVMYGRDPAGLAAGSPRAIEDIEIVAIREMKVVLEHVDPRRANALEVHDAAGELLSIVILGDSIRTVWSGFRPVFEAGPQEFHVRETATTLVLYFDGVEVDRRPLTLVPDGETRVPVH
jgi:hypothetical protein